MSEKEALLPTKRIFATKVPSKVHDCTDHLRSEISPRAIATFHNIEKTRKQEEAISIKCLLCSHFDKILYLL